jgi:hypothetical protein
VHLTLYRCAEAHSPDAIKLRARGTAKKSNHVKIFFSKFCVFTNLFGYDLSVGTQISTVVDVSRQYSILQF